MSNQVTLTSELVSDISLELEISKPQVESTLKLVVDGGTVPFIARYRKEATGGLNEVQIRDIRDKFEYLLALNERKDTILKSIEEQGKLTPSLKNKILTCKVKTELEDLYLPYKPKKRTRGQIAKERGLEPLALAILEQKPELEDLTSLFVSYVGKHEEVSTLEIAIQGAKDYIAEAISEIPEVRGEVRQWLFENASFRAVVRDEFKDQKTKFNNYYDYLEPIRVIASHRMMALRRGEKENILKVTLQFENSVPMAIVSDRVILRTASQPVKSFLSECVEESFSRLIAPSLETELRLETKSKAEEEAISVFAKNLKHLLLLPPIPKKVVLGIDPGMRTGSKLVVVDQTGKLIAHTTVFPDHDSPVTAPKNKNSMEKLLDLILKHKVEHISIGNGTGCREMEAFTEGVLELNKEILIRHTVVNEAGASVYSASDIAREEFPDLDLTYRGSVSIARRLQDPLAELVKIDPKSIGVGQYQHDVNQTKLKKTLEETVESCVNFVGVNLNTASASLLSYVAGIGPSLAKSIVRQRDAKGEFKNRESLYEVMGFGPKAFEQAAGFLRIPESENPLDNSAVHPEAYQVVQKMASDLNVSLKDLIGKKEVLTKITLEKYTTPEFGLPTLQDIVKELLKPGRDPRMDGNRHVYNKGVKNFEDLQENQTLIGTVTNVTNFGAFVDIGVHQDGLIHISELSSQFITNASEAIAVGEQVWVKVIGIDRERKRISLSRKAVDSGAGANGQVEAAGVRHGGQSDKRNNNPGQRTQAQGNNRDRNSGQGARRDNNAQRDTNAPRASSSGNDRKGARSQPAENSAPASVNDLLSKFNSNRI